MMDVQHNDCVIGMDIGGTNVRIGAVGLDGTLLHARKSSSRPLADGTPETAIQDLAYFINGYIRESVPQRVLGIAIAFPATLDARREVLYSASNFGANAKCRYDGMRIAELLAPLVSAPVYLGKDTDFILHQDMHELGIQTEQMVAGIYFGTGIGSSFFYRGETIYGADGVAGEIGHLPISDNRRQCTCMERQGCCETVASGWRLIQILNEHFPGTELGDIFTKHADTEPVDTFVYDMARVLALTGNLLNPAYTVVGGGIPEMKDFPGEKLEAYVRQMLRHPYPRDSYQLRFSPGGQNAGVLGGARYLLGRL